MPLQSGICSSGGAALLPHGKAGMHVWAQTLQQTCTFASCFSIFLHFLTTTENSARVFPFPPPHSAFRQHAKHRHPLFSARDKWTTKKHKLKSQQPCCNVSGKVQCLSPWPVSALKGDGGCLGEWGNALREKHSSCLGLPGAGTAPAQPWRGGSNWFQTLSHGRALYLAASQGSQFGIRVG